MKLTRSLRARRAASGFEGTVEEPLRFHDLRHTAATRMVDAGAPLSVVQELLGHRDIHTTRRYVDAMDDAKRQAVRNLEDRSWGMWSRIGQQKKGQPVRTALNIDSIGSGDWIRTSDLGVMNPTPTVSAKFYLGP